MSALLTTVAEFSLVPVACINKHVTYWDVLLVATILPLALVALAWLLAAFATPESAPQKKAIRFTLLIAFIVLPTTSTKIFRTFLCLDFEEGRFLAADLSIDCDGTFFLMMRFYAACAITVYPVGIPLGFLAVLYKNRTAISSRDISKPCPLELRHIAILFEHYTNGTTSLYWEVVECVRRLLLSSVVVFMGGTSSARTTWGALIAIFFAIVCAEVQPCVDHATQAFAFMAQWYVVLNFLLAVILSAGFNLFSPSAVGTLFVGLTAVVIFGAFAHGYNAKEEAGANGGKVRRSARMIDAQPCVMICAPGRVAESEMAFVLLRVLRDLGYLEPKAIIANLFPQQERSRLLRKQLDALGLHDVPVGVGTNGGAVQNTGTRAPDRSKNDASWFADESDRANEILPGARLLEQTWDKATPASLVLLITSSLKVCDIPMPCSFVYIVSDLCLAPLGRCYFSERL